MTPEEIYKKLEAIPGDNTFSLQNIQQLCEVLGDWRPKGVIELGSLNGRSTAFWALMADRVWTIDIVNRYDVIRENLKKLGLEDKVLIKVADSKTCYWDIWADVVFIDADHTYEGCMADIKRWTPYARKMVCGHDYSDTFEGVKRAVDDMFGELAVTGRNIWAVKKSR